MIYQFTPKALRQWNKLPVSVREEITHKLRYFLNSSQPLAFAEPIIAERHTFRFRT